MPESALPTRHQELRGHDFRVAARMLAEGVTYWLIRDQDQKQGART